MMVPTPSVAITELTFILVTMKPLIEADNRAERYHDEDGNGNRQLVVDDESGHENAVQAGGKAD